MQVPVVLFPVPDPPNWTSIETENLGFGHGLGRLAVDHDAVVPAQPARPASPPINRYDPETVFENFSRWNRW